MGFTYKLPNNEAFYNAMKIIALSMNMPQDEKDKLQRFLDVGCCEITNTGNFSEKRWNAYNANVNIFIPLDRYAEFGNDVFLKSIILRACEQVLPDSVGFDILEVFVSPQLDAEEPLNVIDEINEASIESEIIELNDDLIGKGKQMAKAYIILYVLENRLREFIHKVLTEKIGADYSSAISPKLHTHIDQLKEQERTKKWLPLRGDNDLYYLDFSKLSDLIINNWGHFEDIIPDQHWIKVKLDEMYNIRCLIAHNSYISDENFELLNVTTKQILKQIN